MTRLLTVDAAAAALREAAETARRVAELEAVVGALIEHACPSNWGDDDDSADAWINAARLVGAELPDQDYWANANALARAGGGDA